MRTVKVLRLFFPSLQARKLTIVSYKLKEYTRPRVKDRQLYYSQHNKQHKHQVSIGFPCSVNPTIHEGAIQPEGLYHIWRTPRFRNLNLLWREVSKDKLPWWLNDKQSAYQCRRHGFSPWSGKIPWRRKWQPTPVFLPGEPHGQSSSMCYGSWSQSQTWFSDWTTTRKDTGERYHFHHTVSNFPSIPAGGSITVFQGFDYASILEIIAWNKRAVITSVCKMCGNTRVPQSLSLNKLLCILAYICFWQHCMACGSSLTRDQTLAPCSGNMKS